MREEEEEREEATNVQLELGESRQIWRMKDVFSTISSLVLSPLSLPLFSIPPLVLHLPPPPPTSSLLFWGVLPPPFCSLSEKWSCVPGGGSN